MPSPDNVTTLWNYNVKHYILWENPGLRGNCRAVEDVVYVRVTGGSNSCLSSHKRDNQCRSL